MKIILLVIVYEIAIRFYVFNWSGLTVKKVYSDIRPMEYTDEIGDPKKAIHHISEHFNGRYYLGG